LQNLFDLAFGSNLKSRGSNRATRKVQTDSTRSRGNPRLRKQGPRQFRDRAGRRQNRDVSRPNNNVTPFDVNQCRDGVGRDALQSKGVRQWKKAEEIGHHVIETTGKMHSLRRTIKHTR
jgi:hypothetical protein